MATMKPEGRTGKLDDPITNWDDLKARLQQMKQASKRGDFDSQLKAACVNLRQFLSEAEPREEPEYWKARTMLYELSDIFHVDPDINQQTHDDGLVVYDELQKLSDRWEQSQRPTEFARRLIREKVLFCSCAVNEIKRRGKREKAGRLFCWLLHFTERKLKTAEMPCFGTRAYLSYHLATVYRILENHSNAEARYNETLKFYYERAESRRRNDLDDSSFTTRRVAMCIGLGFGWVNLTRGYLRRAEHALLTARFLLARSPDPVVTHYIELLFGTVKRCRAGKDEDKLREAIRSLQAARQAFKDQKHLRYEARACWELALAFNLLEGEFGEADRHLKVLEEYLEREDSAKWRANVHILRSRMQRNQDNYEEALSEAQTAYQKAQDCEEILPSADALITRGEAYFYLAEKTGQQRVKYSRARADFEQALEMVQQKKQDEPSESGTTNPKIASVCEIRIAQCYARECNEKEAKVHFSAWKSLRPNVEHKWVRELAGEVNAEINKLKENFTISAKDPESWNYRERLAEMQQWLANQALRYTNNNRKAAAKLLGVNRGRLYGWLNSTGKRAKSTQSKKRQEGEGRAYDGDSAAGLSSWSKSRRARSSSAQGARASARSSRASRR